MPLLNIMADKGYIKHNPFKPQGAGGNISWIHNMRVEALLDVNGKQELENIKLEERAKELHTSILSTNRVSRTSQNISIGTGFVSLIFVFITAIKACTDTTPQEIQLLTQAVSRVDTTIKLQKTYPIQIAEPNPIQYKSDTMPSKN